MFVLDYQIFIDKSVAKFVMCDQLLSEEFHERLPFDLENMVIFHIGWVGTRLPVESQKFNNLIQFHIFKLLFCLFFHEFHKTAFFESRHFVQDALFHFSKIGQVQNLAGLRLYIEMVEHYFFVFELGPIVFKSL